MVTTIILGVLVGAVIVAEIMEVKARKKEETRILKIMEDIVHLISYNRESNCKAFQKISEVHNSFVNFVYEKICKKDLEKKDIKKKDTKKKDVK